MALSITEICNMSLGRLGAKRINDFNDGTESSPQAIQCRLHYEQTKKALLRSYKWPFARARETLSAKTETPDFEYEFQYALPIDYLFYISPYEGRSSDVNILTFTIEGDFFLTDEETVELRFIKNIDDVTKFDSLFVETLVLRLALKILPAISGGNSRLSEDIRVELRAAEAQARAVAGQESNSIGTVDLHSWNDARFGNRDPARL